MGNERSLEVLPCTEDRYEDVFDLYERASSRDVERRKQAFLWVHDRNPFRTPQHSYVLGYREGVLAGYWGRMPMRFHQKGEPTTCFFSQETLVDPAFRRQGIARRLMEAAVAAPGLHLALWHNEKIVSLLRSSGWGSVGVFRPMFKVYRVDRFLRWKAGSRLARVALYPPAALAARLLDRTPRASDDIPVEEVDRFDKGVDSLFHEVASGVPFIADRTSATLNWRFADIPYRSFTRYLLRGPAAGQLRGYLVSEVVPLSAQESSGGASVLPEHEIRKGRIVDFLVRPGDRGALDGLMRAADAEFRRRKVDFAAALHTLPAFHGGLARWGFWKRPKAHRSDQLLFLDRRPGDPSPVPLSYSSWAITYGDSDGSLW